MVYVRKQGTVLAHRAVYELFVGVIPKGLQMDHLCRVTLCVNPAHLEPVTQSVNVRRGSLAGPRPRTECVNGHSYANGNVVLKRKRSGITGRVTTIQKCRICLAAARTREHEKRRHQR